MARVPTYDALQVGANTLPNAQVSAPDTSNIGGIAAQQSMQMGAAVQGASEVGGRIVTDMQNEANQLRVIDASNQAKEHMFDLLYNKDNGALNQKGWNALNRESGKDLPSEYAEQFEKTTSKMGESLGNEQQRKMFQQQVASMRTQLYGTTTKHLSDEFKTYQVSTYDGTVATAQREIALMGASGNIEVDPTTMRSKLDDAGDRILASVRQKGRLLGLSAEQSDVEARKVLSNAHTLAIAGALEQGKAEYADAYLQKNIKQMDTDDILHVLGKIDGEVNMRIGVTAAGDVVRKMAPRIQTGDAERVFNIMLGTESNNRQFGKDGLPTTSPTGAIGIAQVMPATAPEAAKLAGLPYDEARYKNDADYNKALGMAYFQKQLQDNGGDVQKAMAAYNAGPGRLEKAIKAAGLAKNDPNFTGALYAGSGDASDWRNHMPKETRDYIAKNSASFAAGQGANQRATFADIDDQLRADPRLANNPKRYQVAREEASRRFEEQTKAIKQKDEENVAGAMRAVVENGGRYSDLPASVRGALPPKEIDNVIGFAQKISKGDDTTSLYLYNSLTAHPERLAQLNDAQFYALRRELSEGDFKHFSNERAKLTGAVPGSNGPGELNSSSIKQTLDGRLRMMNIDPTPKDDGGSEAARIGGIRRFVDQYMMAAQREAGKKFNDTEVSAHVDALFAKNVEFRGWFSNASGPMLGMKIGDIPGDAKSGIKEAFKRMGNDNPTDAQLLNAYWSLKVAKK